MPLKYKLDNGMTVLLAEDKKSPVISAQVWVDTGSINEVKGEEGLSHFIEHLVFKGTEKFKVGEIAKYVEMSGGELNAYTSFDQTVFYVNISKQYSNTALETLSEMMGFPLFDATEIDNEREVVIEEIKRSEDSAQRVSSRLLFDNVFKKTPYARPVIGYEKIIQTVKREKILSYFHRFYGPKKMKVVIVGDFKTADMKKQVQKFFGRIPAQKTQKGVDVAPLTRNKAQVVVEQTAIFKENQFYLTWNTPGINHKDIAALDVLALIFGQGDTSRLVQTLRIKKPLVRDIGSFVYSPRHLGVFAISFSLELPQLPNALAGLRKEWARILKEPPHEDELNKAKVQFESDVIYGLETVEGLARRYGTSEFYMNDYKTYQAFLDRVAKLTTKDIHDVALKYLQPSQAMVVALVSDQKEEVTEQLKTLVTPFPKATAPKKASKSKASDLPYGLEKIQIAPNVRMIFRQNKQVPVLSLKAAFRGGLRAEEAGGSLELLSRTWASGTANMNEAEIHKKTERLASSLSAYTGRNTTGVSLYGLTHYQEDLLPMFFEVLAEPTFPNDVFEREKTVLMEGYKLKNDKPSYLASHMFLQTIFKGHPYERDPQGEEETTAKVTRDDVQKLWAKTSLSTNLTIACVGDFDAAQVRELAEEYSAKLGTQNYTEPKFKLEPLKKSTEEYKYLKKEQSHLIHGFRGLSLTDPDRYALQVIQAILAGQGGRLFLELRDKASLAYSVSPLRFEGLETGYFGTYIACSPHKGKLALEMMKQEINKLVDHAVPELEVERAQKYLIGRHDLELQRTGAVASALLFNEVYDIPAEENFTYFKEIQNITAADVQRVAEKLFTQNSATCAVGSESPF